MIVDQRSPAEAEARVVDRPAEHGSARRVGILLGALALLTGTVLLSLAVGSRSLPTLDVVRVLFSPDGSDTSVIVRELRLPRTVVGLRGRRGARAGRRALQGLTRNPLADPGLLGGPPARRSAVVATSTVLGVGGAAGYVWVAFTGRRGDGRGLGCWPAAGAAGPARSRWCSPASPSPRCSAPHHGGPAATPRPWTVPVLVRRLDRRARRHAAGPVAPFLVVGLLLAVVGTRTLDVLALGDDLARGLGAQVAWGRAGVALSSTLLTAAAVAVAGPLLFVGLVVPHVARALTGPAHRWLLPLSARLRQRAAAGQRRHRPGRRPARRGPGRHRHRTGRRALPRRPRAPPPAGRRMTAVLEPATRTPARPPA